MIIFCYNYLKTKIAGSFCTAKPRFKELIGERVRYDSSFNLIDPHFIKKKLVMSTHRRVTESSRLQKLIDLAFLRFINTLWVI